MTALLHSKYPIYILSKGRPNGTTAKQFDKNGITDYYIVIEPQDYKAYKDVFQGQLIILEKDNQGPTYVRNFILDHSKANGYDYCWQFDDNINEFCRKNNGKRPKCHPMEAIQEVEKVAQMYSNIGVIGFNYKTFVFMKMPRFNYNVRIYSGFLVMNNSGIRFQGEFNLDNDICIQYLLAKYCTVQINYYCINKLTTGLMKGGNYDRYKGIGRYKMAMEINERYPQFTEVRKQVNRYQIKVFWEFFRGNKLIPIEVK